MRVFVVVAALALSLPVQSPLHATSEGADAADAGQKIICKERRKTGTRFTTRTCKTAGQWDKLAEEHRANAKEMIDRPQIETRRGG
jgi:hypothetical protein